MTIPVAYQDIIQRWKSSNPMISHQLGFHEFDGQVPNYSETATNNRIAELKVDIKTLEEMTVPEEKIAKYEYNLVLNTVKTELFQVDVQKEYTKSPMLYVFPLLYIEGSYASRSFAPVEDRVKSIIKLEKNIPGFFEVARQRLEPSLAIPKIQMSMMMLQGFIGYFNDKLISFINQVEDNALIQEWSEVNEKAVEAIKQFLSDLTNTYMPKAHNNFAMGEEKFLELLEYTEGVKITANKLLEIAENDLERNYQAMQEIGNNIPEFDKYIDDIKTDYPKPEELLKYTEETLERTKQFLIDADIVDIPTDSQCAVVDMPDAMKNFGFAAMNTPGAFETPEASEAYYYVNLPDANLPQEKKDQLMQFFNKAFLEIVTVHEAWPGHYLQLLYNNQASSEIAKMFAYSGTMIEGWGHYTEEMIYAEGYEPFDRQKLHVGQLFGALARNVRFVSAVKMHCMGMTVEESKQLFMTKGYLSDTTAQIEANRGTVNPMYLYYTLGKLMIMKLRKDYKREKGDGYSLKKFHNQMLSYGSPPITVLRSMMLENPGNMEDVL